MKPSASDQVPKDVLGIATTMSCLIQLLNTCTLNLGNGEDGKPIRPSCHILARAILEVFQATTTDEPMLLKDGCFYPNFRHSWIQVGDTVLDVYPVGSIVGQEGGLIIWPIPDVSRHLFLQDDEVARQNAAIFAKGPHRVAVETVAEALRQVLEA